MAVVDGFGRISESPHYAYVHNGNEYHWDEEEKNRSQALQVDADFGWVETAGKRAGKTRIVDTVSFTLETNRKGA